MARGVILLAIVCLFLCRIYAQYRDFTSVEVLDAGQPVVVTGTIHKKEWKGEDEVYYLKNAFINDVPVKHMLLRVPKGDCSIGAVIQTTCKMRFLKKASNTGGYDERQYYHSLGIAAVLYADVQPVILEQKQACPIRNGLYHLRYHMREVYKNQLNERDAGILSSMVLGDKSLMEDELKQLYNGAGISHLLAVSGLHVSIIGMTLFQFLRKRGCGYWSACFVSGIVLLLFVVMSGLSVSAIRAGGMFLIYLGAQLLGRKYVSLRGLIFAAVMTLLMNPSYIYNAGFLFSYSAVFGAVAIAPLFTQRIGRCKSAILSGSILLTTLPLTAYYYYEIPVYSLLVNLMVIPLAGIVMGFGLLGGLAGTIWNIIAMHSMLLADTDPTWVLFIPCHFVLRLYEVICKGVSCFPLNTWITGRPPMVLLALYYGLILVLVICCRKGSFSRLLKKTVFVKQKTKLYFLGKPIISIVPMFLFVSMFLLPPTKQCQISFLDVGQGDGIYINSGSGVHYFVDGGSTSEQEVGRYTILPFLKYHRVRQIDVWFVSHADTDHISGLLEALEKGYPIETIVLSKNVPEDENYLLLVNAAQKNRTDIVRASNGGTMKDGTCRIVCYTPNETNEVDRNPLSLVCMVEFSAKDKDREEIKNATLVERSQETYKILLTGDIGSEQEEWLLTQPGVSEIDILKSAHHGSKYSNSEVFLQEIRPEVTVISCGENNRYGHPHKETLDRLADVGSKVLLTMELGEITIRP